MTATRLLSIPLVALGLLAGIWVTGGLVTNDFRLAMLVAGAAGLYLGRSQFVDDVLDERVATVSPAPGEDGGAPRNELVARGMFEGVAHSARGTARVIGTPGGRVLTLTGFDVSNGPDLRVYVVAGPARSEAEVDGFTTSARSRATRATSSTTCRAASASTAGTRS